MNQEILWQKKEKEKMNQEILHLLLLVQLPIFKDATPIKFSQTMY